MRWLLLILTLGLAGCAQTKSTGANSGGQAMVPTRPPLTTSIQTNKTTPVITPSLAIKGKVARANPTARHAILSFPIGQMPPLGCRLNVYRSGLKVGEVTVTGPVRDIHIAADIVAGECQAGDEVRGD